MLTEAGLVGEKDFFTLLRVPTERRDEIFDVLDRVMTEQYRYALQRINSGHDVALDRGIISSQATHQVLQLLSPEMLLGLNLPSDLPEWAKGRFQRLKGMENGGVFKDLEEKTSGYIVCIADPEILHQRAGGGVGIRTAESASFMGLLGLQPEKQLQQYDGKNVLVLDTGKIPIIDEKRILYQFVESSI
jgi:hypothetical protein